MNITATATTEDGLTATRYAAIIDGTEAGYLLAHTSGLILNVEVNEDHQGEGIATDAVGGRFHDRQACGGRDGGVNGVPALFHHLQTGLGGERL